MSPLHGAAGWLTFLGWVMLIYGIFVCLSIVGILFGWLPIWMGILLKGAGARLKSGFATSNNGDLYEASRNLSTYFTIMAVMTMISFGFTAIYLLVILFAILGGGFAAMSGM